MKLKKLFFSWRHFGTAMMISKAWEKYFVDKWRFRINVERKVPVFPHCGEVPIPRINPTLF